MVVFQGCNPGSSPECGVDGRLGTQIILRGPEQERCTLDFKVNDTLTGSKTTYDPGSKSGTLHLRRDLLPVVLDMLRRMRSKPVDCEMTNEVEDPEVNPRITVGQNGP